MHRLCVLVSGNGTTLQSIIDAIEDGRLNAIIALVVSSRPDAYALTRAQKHGIASEAIDFRALGREEYDRRLLGRLKAVSPDLICLAGYLKILEPQTVKWFAGRIVNIHPALLPKFGGKGMYGDRVHEAVLRSGEKHSGCTVHFVTEGVDVGPVITQEIVPVRDDDTVDSLKKRVHEAETRTYPRAISMVLDGKSRLE